MRSRYKKRYWDDPPLAVQVALVILTLLVVGSIMYALASYEKTIRVTVTDRWWDTAISVTYETEHTGIRSVPETTCSGFGKDQQCTTSIRVERYTYYTTHTRCRDANRGRELPAVIPDPPCRVHFGDDVNRYKSYHITYREEETTRRKEAGIKLDQWERLQPERRATLVLDVLGNVRRLEME